MIKHVVMFKSPEEPDNDKKQMKMAELKLHLENLPSVIDVIQSFECGININQSARSYDLILISTFGSPETLQQYQVHPEHLKVVDFIRQNGITSVVVDYKF